MISKPCPCGSGLASWWENDARGIPVARICVECGDEVLGKYRPEIFNDPDYEANEPIDGDW